MYNIPLFPRPVSWLSAGLLYVFLGLWMTFVAAVLPRIYEHFETSPRLAALGFLAVWTSPVVDRDANVYFGTRSGQIVGFSWTGRLLFDIDAGSTATIDSYPAITGDGALIVGDTDGVVRAVADDGTLPPDARPAA